MVRLNRFKRANSSIISLRTFHNWVKNELFIRSNTLLHDDNINEVSILELAVGRGGDLYKWKGIRAKEVVGIDIDNESINGKNGAYHRYNKEWKRGKYSKDSYVPKCTFHVCDVSAPKCFWKMKAVLKEKKFQIVSCQFALHYFFRDKASLETMMKFVSSFIADGGYFIITTMNGNKIKEKLTTSTEISNKAFTIERKFDPDTKEVFGNEYIVTLGEKGEDHYFARDSSIEYLVDKDALVDICLKNGLVLKANYDFQKWYKIYEEKGPEHIMKSDEKEFSFLNYSFIFQKI